MRPYGLPRDACRKYPDMVQILRYGLKSRKSKLPGKDGCSVRTTQTPEHKASSRRYYKRAARRASKKEIAGSLASE